jgi:hypothetical protein
VAGALTEEQIDPAARDKLLLLFHDWKTGRPRLLEMCSSLRSRGPRRFSSGPTTSRPYE